MPKNLFVCNRGDTVTPLMLADDTLRCGMYPTGKVAISRHLATPRFPQCDHTVGKLSFSFSYMTYLKNHITKKYCFGNKNELIFKTTKFADFSSLVIIALQKLSNFLLNQFIFRKKIIQFELETPQPILS